MELELKQDLLGIAIVQLSILGLAWAFYTVVRINASLALPDAVAIWVYQNPTETTFIVTIISTVASAMTLSCFTRAAKHALRQYIGAHRSISLVNLSMGVAVARASFTCKRRPRYLGPTVVTLFIAVVFGLVNSAWTTFLNPVRVSVVVTMTGQELDLGNQAFDTVLGQDINNTFGFANGTLVAEPIASDSLTTFAFTGGLTAAIVFATGQARIFDFNNVTYNVSTGGVLPAAPGYGDTQDNSTASGTPASFSGGSVPTNLNASSGLTGISSTYEIIQQGLTANVTCSNYTDPSDWYPIDVQAISANATLAMGAYDNGVFPVVNTTVPYLVCNPNTTNDGNMASIASLNFNNTDYVASAVCPTMWQDSVNTDRIFVYHGGLGKYAQLPPTICEIVLLLTQSTVTYANQLVALTPQNTTTVPSLHNLNFWMTLFVEIEKWRFQSDRRNSLGNLLLSLLTSGPASFSQAPSQSFQISLEFWRGVVEVAGTALRSGYTAYPQNVTSMQIPIRGVQNISTMGWSFGNNKTREYALVPITLTAAMTFAAIFIALYHLRLSEASQGGPKSTLADVDDDPTPDGQLGRLVVPHKAIETFDASDPIHLIVASAARGLIPGPQTARRTRYWDQHEESRVVFQLEH